MFFVHQIWPGSLKVWPGSLKVWPGSLKVWSGSLKVWPSRSFAASRRCGGSIRYGAPAWRRRACARAGAAAIAPAGTDFEAAGPDFEAARPGFEASEAHPHFLVGVPPQLNCNFWGPGEDNRRGRTDDLTRLVTPKGSAD